MNPAEGVVDAPETTRSLVSDIGGLVLAREVTLGFRPLHEDRTYAPRGGPPTDVLVSRGSDDRPRQTLGWSLFARGCPRWHPNPGPRGCPRALSGAGPMYDIAGMIPSSPASRRYPLTLGKSEGTVVPCLEPVTKPRPARVVGEHPDYCVGMRRFSSSALVSLPPGSSYNVASSYTAQGQTPSCCVP